MQSDNETARNVLGRPLESCSGKPRAGFYRDGCCKTGEDDAGVHTVCAEMTTAFLVFSKMQGNDLSTPLPQYGFPGLKAGDRWCVCAARWKEAFDVGLAPPVVLASTHEATLLIVPIDELMSCAVAHKA
jgi:hypothetical protein